MRLEIIIKDTDAQEPLVLSYSMLPKNYMQDDTAEYTIKKLNKMYNRLAALRARYTWSANTTFPGDSALHVTIIDGLIEYINTKRREQNYV
jgi:hypothetical protein